MMKRISALAALMLLLCVFAGASAERVFIDSTGREVTVSDEINKVAVSGPVSQIILFALCPDKLVGVASKWSEAALPYFDQKYLDLPLLGQLYGGKGELNLETLLASGAEVVIDMGEPKKTVCEDMEALQEQTGIPFVHIDAFTTTMGDAYRKAGELLNMADEAEKLASYCDEVYADMLALSASVEKARILYITGEGQNVIAKGSYHAEIIDLLAENLAVVDDPSSKSIGNEVDMEQILDWDPDIILFSPGELYETLPEDETWQTLTAIEKGNYYEVPEGPYNWMGIPPSVQRYLGMLWMADVLYPESVDYDLYEEAAAYFEMFYHKELTEDRFAELVANSAVSAE